VLFRSLFGHEKGSFTSAYEARKGYFEEVEGGTIFMDEIGEMPVATQARLLRLLENGEFLRVGSSKVQKADVRVIAATNKDLIELIQQGRFRQDLYFRLNRITIYVPPLRERGDDIELLFNFFANEFADKYQRDPLVISEEALPLIYQYRWPGNVRELKNLVEKLSLILKNDLVTPDVLRSNLLVQESYLPTLVRPSIESNGIHDESYTTEDVKQLYQLIYDMGKQLGKEIADIKRMIYLGFQNADMGNGQYPVGGSGNRGGAYAGGEYGPTSPKPLPRLEESLSLERKEKELIVKALDKHGNNRKKAASDLGISERTLYRKIKNYDIAL